MQSKDSLFKKPIFISIILIIAIMFIIIIFVLIKSNNLFDVYNTYKISTEESVSGLAVGAPVEYKGVNVGTVKSISLQDSQRIEILLNIKNDMILTMGTVASLTSKGLTTRGFTGFVYVDLNKEGSNTDPLPITPGEKYPIIPTIPSTHLNIDRTFHEVSEDLKQVTSLLQSLLSQDTLGSLKDVLTNLKVLTNTLVENNQTLNSLLIHADEASKELVPWLKSSQKTFIMLEKDILPSTSETMNEVDDLLQQLSKLTSDLKQNPSLLIRGTKPLPPGPGE